MENLLSAEIIEGVVGLIGVFIMLGIKTLTGFLKEKTKNEKIKASMDIVNSILIDAVKQTEQTLKKDIKNNSVDGKLSSHDRSKLIYNVVSCVNNNLTKSVKKEALKAIPSIERYVLMKTESIVHDAKNDNTSNSKPQV